MSCKSFIKMYGMKCTVIHKYSDILSEVILLELMFDLGQYDISLCVHTFNT